MARRGENIHKRKDGRWEGRYYEIDFTTDRKKTKSVYGKTYSETKKKLLAAKANAGRTVSMPDSGIPFDEIAAAWLRRIEAARKHSTYIKYAGIYEHHIKPVIGEKRTCDLTRDIFRTLYLPEMSVSLKKSICSVTNQIIQYGNDIYRINMEKTRYPKAAAKTGVVEILSSSAQASLLQILYSDMDSYKLGILICLSTGLRLGEICALKWRDIDFQEKLLYVNRSVQRISVKNQKSKTILWIDEPKSVYSKREIPLSDILAGLLLCMKNDGEYVITPNRPTEPRTMQNHFMKCLKDAQIEKRNFHSLRHTFATNCINAGVDVKSLSEILGHSDVSITLNRYVHSTIESKRTYLNRLSAIYGQHIGHKCR